MKRWFTLLSLWGYIENKREKRLIRPTKLTIDDFAGEEVLTTRRWNGYIDPHNVECLDDG